MNTTERDDLTKEIEAAAEKYVERETLLLKNSVAYFQARDAYISGANLLKARVERLEEALKFYAEIESTPSLMGHLIFVRQLGHTARAALEGKES